MNKSSTLSAYSVAIETNLIGPSKIELPAPGLGELHYDLYLQRLAQKHPNIPMIIEHLEEADVPRAKKFLDGKLRANGL